MQKQINISELEYEVNNVEDIKEPIIVKRKNKKDLVLISLEQYKKDLFMTEISNKVKKSKEEVKQGKTHDARNVFKELRAKYSFER